MCVEDGKLRWLSTYMIGVCFCARLNVCFLSKLLSLELCSKPWTLSQTLDLKMPLHIDSESSATVNH